MKLNIRAQSAQNLHNNSPIVLVHGLFGSLDNLGVLARDLVTDHDIIQVDMRNHGLSPRDPVMDYPAMAQDLWIRLTRSRLKSDVYWSFHGRKSGNGADGAGARSHRSSGRD